MMLGKLKTLLGRKSVKIGIAGLLVLGLLLSPVNVQINSPPQDVASPDFTIGQHQIVLTIGTDVYAAGVADYTCDGVQDNIQFQLALNALPAGGGKIVVLTGNYVFAATVTRAIDNVEIQGNGYASYIANDGGTALFSAGAQNRWIFRDFRTDAGSITIGAATDWVMENMWLGANYWQLRVDTTILASNYDIPFADDDHHVDHENAGTDEINVVGLSGLLADDQHVLDAEAIAAAETIKLDDFAVPDDNVDLDFSTARHGLVPKGTDVGNFLRDDGTWAAGGGGGGITVVAANDSSAAWKAAATSSDGSVCDAVDDEVNIKAAIELGGRVLLAPGTFEIDTNPIWIEADNDDVLLEGCGGLTILKVTSAINCIVIGEDGETTGYQARRVVLRDFTIDGNSLTAIDGVFIQHGCLVWIKNLYIYHCKRWAIEARYMCTAHIEECDIEANGHSDYTYSGGIAIGGIIGETDNVPFHTMRIDNCWIHENDTAGILISQGVAITIRDCDIEGNDEHGLVLDVQGGVLSVPESVLIESCGFESNNMDSAANIADIYTTDTVYHLTIRNCWFTGSTVTWNCGLGQGSSVSVLDLDGNNFINSTVTNVNTGTLWASRIRNNIFSTAISVNSVRGLEPVDIAQWYLDPDEAFDSLSDGMSLHVSSRRAAGVWELSSKFTFPADNITIFGDGPSSCLKLANGVNDGMLYATGRSGLVIRDLKLDGNRVNNAGAAVIHLDACTDSQILNNEICEADDDGGIVITGSASERINITGNYIHDYDLYGIEMDAGTDCKINHNYILSGYQGIQLNGHRNEVCENALENFHTSEGAGINMTGNDNIIANNHFQDMFIGIEMVTCDDNVIQGNIFRGTGSGLDTPINVNGAANDRNMIIGNNWYSCDNDMSDTGTNTRVTSNVNTAGAWFAGDDPG